jgi:polysaccharide biosynthesis transport protein
MYDEKLDMRNIAAIISRRRKILYGILGTAIFAALLFSFLQPTKYEGTVSVRVQYPRGASDNTAVLPSEALIQQQILTYAEIAKSKAVVQPVIDYMYADKDEKPLYDDMIKLIDAKPVRGTDMLVLSILAGTPSEAQKAADYLLTTFNAKLTDIARLQGKESRLFIGERMGEAKKELDNAE